MEVRSAPAGRNRRWARRDTPRPIQVRQTFADPSSAEMARSNRGKLFVARREERGVNRTDACSRTTGVDGHWHMRIRRRGVLHVDHRIGADMTTRDRRGADAGYTVHSPPKGEAIRGAAAY